MLLSSALAAESRITLPLTTIIRPKIRVMRLVIATPMLVLIIEQHSIIIHCTNRHIENSRQGGIDSLSLSIKRDKDSALAGWRARELVEKGLFIVEDTHTELVFWIV